MYVDGYLLPVPTKHLALYKRMASQAGKIWKKHGALLYVEAAGDDMKPAMCDVTFPALAGAKKTETVIFAFVGYKNRKHRDRVNKKVFEDPYMQDEEMHEKMKPFDMKRMAYGGFEAIVDL